MSTFRPKAKVVKLASKPANKSRKQVYGGTSDKSDGKVGNAFLAVLAGLSLVTAAAVGISGFTSAPVSIPASQVGPALSEALPPSLESGVASSSVPQTQAPAASVPNPGTLPDSGVASVPEVKDSPAPNNSPPSSSLQTRPITAPPSARTGSLEVLVSPYTPCGNMYCKTRLEGLLSIVRSGSGSPIPYNAPTNIFIPYTGEFLEISNVGDLQALQKQPGWLNLFYSYGLGECSRHWEEIGLNPATYPFSLEAAQIFWRVLNEYSRFVRVAATPQQQDEGLITPSRMKIAIKNNANNLPVLSFDEHYQKVTGAKYPADQSITNLDVNELVKQGYIYLVEGWESVQFNIPAAFGETVGFGFVAPSFLGLQIDYTAHGLGGFDFPSVEAVDGKIGPHLMVMQIDEPGTYNGLDVNGNRYEPFRWSITAIDKSGKKLAVFKFDTGITFDSYGYLK